MPEQLWFTEFLNHYLGAMTTSILRLLGVHPAFAKAPITNTVAMEILAVLFLLIFFALNGAAKKEYLLLSNSLFTRLSVHC